VRRATGFRIGLAVTAAALVAGGWILGPAAAFHFLPLGWTGEADRLAAVLRIEPGMTVADIGAGSGRLAFDLARRVGPDGRVLATELDPDKREALARRARDLGLRQVQVITAGERETGLSPECCDAAFMRNVLHHIDVDVRPDYTVSVAEAMKPGGVFVVIDFRPGAIGFLARDHGVSPEEVKAAFAAAGFRLLEHVPAWGGRMYLLAFRSEGGAGESNARRYNGGTRP
jgi:ubiquinone/menaquinone biosynthesis C-methylase UbiE